MTAEDNSKFDDLGVNGKHSKRAPGPVCSDDALFSKNPFFIDFLFITVT